MSIKQALFCIKHITLSIFKNKLFCPLIKLQFVYLTHVTLSIEQTTLSI